MNKALAQEAEVVRISRLCGIIENAAIVAWADEKIGEGSVEDELLDISTNPLSTADYLSKLRGLARGADSFEAVRALCVKVRASVEKDPGLAGQFAGALYQVSVENNHQLPPDLGFLTSAADDVAKGESGRKQFLENLGKVKAGS